MEEVVYLELNDTVLELVSVKNLALASSEHWQIGYRIMSIAIKDMVRTVEYLKGIGIELSWGPVTIGTSKRTEIKDPMGSQSSCGNGRQ